MTNESVDPMVPDMRGRNRNRESLENGATVDAEGVREEMEALEREAPFVPTVAKRRGKRIRDGVAADD